MNLRAGAGRTRLAGAGIAGGLLLMLAACGDAGQRAVVSPTPQCDATATTPRAAAGSPWIPVAADLPVAFRAQAWAASGADRRIYVEGADQLLVLDPSSASWTQVAGLPRHRAPAPLTVAKDGTVYIVGGPGPPGSAGGASAVVDAFHPATAAWSLPAPLPSSRFLSAVTAGGDGRVYALGGLGPAGDPQASVEAFDPAKGTWSAVAPLAAASSDLAAVTLSDGRVLVVGGAAPGASVTPAEIFDPSRDAWSTVAPLPAHREGVGAARAADGRVVVAGGRDERGQVTTTVEVFDPTSSQWRAAPSMSMPRVDPGVALGPDGRVYVIGGDTTPVGGPGCSLVGTVEAAQL